LNSIRMRHFCIDVCNRLEQCTIPSKHLAVVDDSEVWTVKSHTKENGRLTRPHVSCCWCLKIIQHVYLLTDDTRVFKSVCSTPKVIKMRIN